MKPISKTWTDSERLFVIMAIAERIRDGEIVCSHGLESILLLSAWHFDKVEQYRHKIMEDAGLEDKP